MPELFHVARGAGAVSGPFKSRSLSAHGKGWLLYRHRADGWYSAEWWLERKTVALCGPCKLPSGASVAVAA